MNGICAQRAGGNPWVYLPQCVGEFLAGGMARVAFLSIDAFGLVSFPCAEYTLQQCCFQPLVGDVCVKAILPWWYEVAMDGLSKSLKRKISPAQSDFSCKSGVAFKSSKLPAPTS